MSSHLYEETADTQPTQVVWAGVIAKTLIDFADRADVIIPGLDASVVWKDCRWQSRNDIDFPQDGDSCLVLFDNNNELWVVCWWPF